MDYNIALNQLDQLGCKYAFYFCRKGQEPILRQNCERFFSASIIKVPILLAWLYLENLGEVNREELCNLDDEPEVRGAGFAFALKARKIPFQDVLLMMITLSDNLCTNLILRRMDVNRANQVIHDVMGLHNTEIQRKLMDYEARSRGLDNWICAQDSIKFFSLVKQLNPQDRKFAELLLGLNQDDALLRRNIPRDTIEFNHKTGSMEGILHDWGYYNDREIFLFTQDVKEEPPVFEIFGKLGELLIAD